MVNELIVGQAEPQVRLAISLADSAATALACMSAFKRGTKNISPDDYIAGLEGLVAGTLQESELFAVQSIVHASYSQTLRGIPFLEVRPAVRSLYTKILQPPSDCILASISRAGI